MILLLHLVVFGHDSARGGHADRSWDSGANVGNWSEPINWSLNQVPVAIDVVSIGQLPIAENSRVNLDTIQAVRGLEITDGMVLDTNGFPFAVAEEIVVDGRNVTPGLIHSSRLFVENSFFLDDLVAGSIFVSDGANLTLVNGSRVRINTYLSVESSRITSSLVRGKGTIDFYRNTLLPDGPFSLRAASFGGGLRVDPGGMTLNQNGSARIDLDGIADTGLVSLAEVGGAPEVLTVNGDALFDAFDGEILVAGQNRLNMKLTNGWELGENGHITFNDFGGDVPVIEGSDLDFRGMLILQRRVITTDFTDDHGFFRRKSVHLTAYRQVNNRDRT